MVKQRISYIDPANIADVEMRNEFERCRTRGTPRPESQAIRAHVPSTFWSFAKTWQTVFHEGVADHTIKLSDTQRLLSGILNVMIHYGMIFINIIQRPRLLKLAILLR